MKNNRPKPDLNTIELLAPAGSAETARAAILAGVGVGVYESFEEAIKETIVITRVQEPDMEAHAKYQESMKLYLELIDALTPIFDRKH